MARKHTEPRTVTVYTSPEGRVVITRCLGDYTLCIDGTFIGFYTSEAAALVEANVRLHELAGLVQQEA